MSPVHIYTGDWGEGQNQGIVMLNEGRYQTAAEGDGLGVQSEASAKRNGNIYLAFNSLSDAQFGDTRYIDVYAKGLASEGWSMEAPAWVKLSKTSGTVAAEERILVTIDWSKTSAGTNTGEIVVKDGGGTEVAKVSVEAVNKNGFDYGGKKGYVEANGYVMIEAEHYSSMTPGSDGSKWYPVYDRGPRGDAMKVSDGLSELNSNTSSGAKLTYNVYFEKAGSCKLTYYRVFSLNEGSTNGVTNACRTMIAVNGQNIDLLKGSAVAREGNWNRSIHTSNEPLSFDKIEVKQGWNTIEVIRSSPSVMFDGILIVPYGEIGQLETSLLGPQVSPNNIMEQADYADYSYGVGKLPEAITSYKAGPTLSVAYGETKTFTVEGLTAAASTEPSVVSVDEVSSGSITVTGHHAGTVKLNTTINGEEITMYVKVGVNANAGKGVYQEKDGLLVIDALDALANTDFAKATGSNNKYNWSKSDFGLQVLPDDGGKWNDANGPYLTYVVNITNEGDYYLRLHSSSPNGNADDYHLVIDGGSPITKWTGTGNVWNYLNDDWAKVTLTAGQHTVQLFAGEDGLTINQLVLSKNKNDSFTGLLTPSETAAAKKQLQMDDIAPLSISENAGATEVNVSAKVLYSTDNDKITFTATSGTTSVATVAVNNGKVLVTPVAPGTANITVTASVVGNSDIESVSKTFTVTVLDAVELAKAYKPNGNGNIIINAADAKDNKPYATLKDSSDSTYHWVAVAESSNTSMQVQKYGDNPTSLKDGVTTGTPWADAGTWVNAPQMTYKVTVPQAGDYYLNVYSYAWNTDTDAFHFVLNGTHKFRAGKDEGYFQGEGSYGSLNGDRWWCGTDKARFHLNGGENTITITGRKSGYVLWQIMLTTAKQTSLNGWQATDGATAETKLTLGGFQNVSLVAGNDAETIPVIWELTGSKDTVNVSVTSSNESVAAVSYADKTISVNLEAAGEATITVTATAGSLSVEKTFTVTVNDASDAAKVYSPNGGGIIIINAADSAQNKPYATIQDGSAGGATYRWVKVTEDSNESMQVQKDGDSPTALNSGVTTGTPWDAANTWENAPQMTYKVSVPRAGTYYLNVYSYSWNDQSNSFHFILNDQHQFRAGKDTGKFTNEKDQWGSIKGDEWFYGNVQLNLNAGENTITIAGRKSGFVLRQIMLSPAQQTTLTGWLTACEPAEPTATADEPLQKAPRPEPIVPEEILTPEQPETTAPEVQTPEQNDVPELEEPGKDEASEQEEPGKNEAPEQNDAPVLEDPNETETPATETSNEDSEDSEPAGNPEETSSEA